MTASTVSVCMNTFNRGRYLRDALDSVFAQTHPALEVIVVDDASTDDTLDILRSYGDRIRVDQRASNSGTADIPRYRAVELSRGDYCAFLDSDDVWLPNKLERQMEFMAAHPEMALCHAYVRMIDAEGRQDGVRHENAIPASGRIGAELLKHCFICTSTVLVRKEVWLSAQRTEDITGFGTEWDFFISIARAQPIGFIPEVLALYRRSDVGISQKNWRRRPRDVVACERIYRKGLWRDIVGRDEYRRIMAESYAENADFWRGQREHARSAWCSYRGIRRAPFHAGLWLRLLKAAAGFS